MSSQVERLPPFFPLKVKKCAEVADTFFACFEKNSLPNGDKEVGRKALMQCQEQLQAYEKCMERYLETRPGR
ncbi:hypothetical protein BC832DRAFT_402819 [Gaertneriomyces semiglobifer]|nr:hypothetical protein BC832DRAFT_402819 [Gaertneriomyces semiglobifer]